MPDAARDVAVAAALTVQGHPTERDDTDPKAVAILANMEKTLIGAVTANLAERARAAEEERQ